MSSSNCCFLTCIQVSQEAGQAIWYSHLFPNFPVYCDPHSQIKGLGGLNTETENIRASPLAIAIKNPPTGAGDRRDAGSILVWGRSSGGGHGNPATSSILACRIPRTEEPRGLLKRQVRRSHLFQNFPQFIVMHTVKGFDIVILVGHKTLCILPP